MLFEHLWPGTEEHLQALEQHVNDGSPSGWSGGPHQVYPEFRPTEGRFALPTYEVPQEYCAIFGDPRWLLTATADNVRLPIHPDVKSPLESMVDPLTVWATSSARTVCVVGSEPLRQLKLHYPGLLGRAPRELTARRIRMSVAVSDELVSLGDALDDRVGFLPERVGVAFADREDGSEVGVIVRDASALLPQGDATTVLPWFSLTSQDSRRPDDDTLLGQLTRTNAWCVDDVVENLVKPLLTSFFELAGRWGLVPEAHGQNVLVALDARGRARCVVHRDLLDVVVDPLVRHERGLDGCAEARWLDESDPDLVYAWRSWAFDFKLGEYALEPVIVDFARSTSISTREVRAACAAASHEVARSVGVDLESYFRPWSRVSYLDGRIPAWGRRPTLLSRQGPAYR